VEIVNAPVTPTPTSAYALLRRKTTEKTVECVRFAWSPLPERIELLNPTDLKTNAVRRRAVFQWDDVVRCTDINIFSIQKIESSGASHFKLLK